MKPIPISKAPRDGSSILIMVWRDGELLDIDVGSWGCVDNGNWETGDKPFDGWLSNDGKIEEPTHYLPMPETPDEVEELSGDDDELEMLDDSLGDVLGLGTDDELF